MDQYEMNSSTSAWDFFVKLAFAVAVGATMMGIYMLPIMVARQGLLHDQLAIPGVFDDHHVQDHS